MRRIEFRAPSPQPWIQKQIETQPISYAETSGLVRQGQCSETQYGSKFICQYTQK
jgi:hypothetical protein